MTENVLLFDHFQQLRSSAVNLLLDRPERRPTHGETWTDVQQWVCPEPIHGGTWKVSRVVTKGYVSGQTKIKILVRKGVLRKYSRIAGDPPPPRLTSGSSRMQLTLHAIRRTPHGASRLVLAISA